MFPLKMKINVSIYAIHIFCFLALSPIALPIGSVGSKPIDLVFIDLFLMMLIIFLLLSKKVLFFDQLVFFSSLLFVIYSLLLGLAGSILDSSLINFISSIKFIKPWLIFIVFCLLGNNFDIFSNLSFFKAVSRSAAVCVLVLVFSQIYIVQTILPRWGSNFIGIETYGFPNTTGQYLGVIVSLLLLGFFMDARLRLLYVLCGFAALLTAIMTLSRSGMFVTIITVLLFWLMRAPKHFLLFLLSLPVILVLAILVGMPTEFDNSIIDILEKIQNRMDRLVSADPLSGRGLIWDIALTYVNENIIFGSMFSPFSLISGHHQSAHNQYIETFYKVGIIGSVFFIFALAAVFHRLLVNSFSNNHSLVVLATTAFVSMLALSIGNFTQPNYTDSLVGGILFALAGLSIGVLKRNAG